jgi:hypothetical protein
MNAKDVLHYGHDFVTRNLVDLPLSHWDDANVCGWWSTKDILAHLASFEYMLAEVLHGYLGGGPTPTLQVYGADPGKFNDDQVAARKGHTPQQVFDEYAAKQAETMDLIAKIPAEVIRQAGTLPWYGLEYSLDDYIVYQYYGHKREHTAQINVFKDLLKAQGVLPGQ